jgi:hypothetical protein
VVPEGCPPPQGTFCVDFQREPGTYSPNTFPIKDGEVRIEVSVPNEISYRMDRTIGYWIKDNQGIAVGEGSEPFIVDVPAVPAGTIHGTITGVLTKETNVSLLPIKQESEDKLLSFQIRPEINSQGFYSASPLPIGGTYAILAKSGAAAVVSAPIKLTDAEPIREVDLTIPEGLPIAGNVTLPDGSPAAGVMIRLTMTHEVPHRSSGFSESTITDAKGDFRFEHVNPDAPLKYALEIKPESDYQELREEIEPGRTAHLELEKGAVVEGTLVEDTSGLPVPGAEVYAYSRQPNSLVEAQGRTNEDGKFRFTTMGNYEYRLGARDATEIEEYLVTPGGHEPVVLRVEIPEGSRLKPGDRTPQR